MEQETKKSNRGGYREGSGRPATGRTKSISVRIEPEAYDILKQQPNQYKFINDLILDWGKRNK